MPSKGAKRAAPAKATGAQKRAKRTPEEEMLQRVVAVLQGAEQLPPSCREMLVAMAADGLNVVPGERHASQERVVGMIGSVLDEVRAAKDEAVAREAEKVKVADEKMAALQAASAAATAELTSRAETVTAAEEKVSAAQAAVAEATSACAAAAQAQKAVQDTQAAARADSESFDAAIKDQFTVLLEGSWETAEQAQDLLQSLAPFTAQLTLDESLRSALPAAGARKPSERGTFDVLVIEQAQKAMAQRAEELQTKLAGCAPAVEEAIAAVESAQGQLAQAQAAAEERAAELQAAQGKQAESEATCQAAAQEVKAFAKELKQVGKEHAKAQADLNTLQAPLDAFTTLRDGPAKVVEPVAEEVPAAVIAEGGA